MEIVKEEEVVKLREFTLTINEEQVGQLNILIDSGLVNMHSFQNTMSNVFYQKENEAQHLELMQKLFDLKANVSNQIVKQVNESKVNGNSTGQDETSSSQV